MDAHPIYLLGFGKSRHRAMMVDEPAREEWRTLDTPGRLAPSWRPPRLRFYLPGETGLSGDPKRGKPLPGDTDTFATGGGADASLPVYVSRLK